MVRRRAVLASELGEMPLDEHFGHVIGQVTDRPGQLRVFGHIDEQRVDARRTDDAEHGVAVGIGQGEVAH